MIVNVKEFDFNIIAALPEQPRPSGNQGTKARRQYKDIVCAFDIETSYLESIDASVLYIWQFQIDEALTVIGRTWKDFLYFLEGINRVLPKDVFIVTYVHNLSYEFQFCRSLFDICPDDVFVVKSRRILKWLCGHIEFRCSYLQSNMSLSAFTEKFNVAHKKLSGEEFDYKKIRYPDTKLSEKELEYCVNDVRGLVEAIKAEMARDNDNLYTIPLTSTGYVRRDVKRVLREWGIYRVRELLPSYEVYTLLREAFRGGNTHANRYFVKNPEYPLPPIENVHSADRSSSYPDVQVNYKFPMTPFKRVEKPVTYTELKEHYIKRRGYALIFRLSIDNLQLRDKYNPCPYISYDKARHVLEKDTDNGRLIGAAHCEVTITDIDFGIIDKQYVLSDDNTQIADLYFSRYDYLPDVLRELIKGYYRQKTELKGIADQQLFYDKFKNLINAIYGCSAQDPAKENLLYYQDGKPDPETHEPDPDNIYDNDDKSVEDILRSAHPTMPYQWGVWTTARARERLQLMIDAVHETKGCQFVYTDTDSVKYVGDFDLETINKDLRHLAIDNGAYADDIKGERHYMGIYEDEGTYKRFETMGAKSYIYEDKNYNLHITIAGVPKDQGAMELIKMACDKYPKGCAPVSNLAQALNTDAFKLYGVGAIFHDGVTETRYNDTRQYKEMEIDGHMVEVTSNLQIKDSFHQIGFAHDYAILLSNLTKKDIDRIRQLLI